MRISITYLLTGAGFGALFPLVSTMVMIASHGSEITFGHLVEAQENEPLLWVIDSAPFFLGMFAWMAGIRQEQLEAIGRDASNDLQQLFRTSQDILCVCSVDGIILRCNPALEKLLGEMPDSITGKLLSDLVHPEDRQPMQEVLGKISESGSDLQIENRLATTGDSDLYVEWSISRPLEGKFLAIGRNITQKKEQERELVRNAESLERSLNELDKFAYVISHDLKSPLRGMHTLADFIAEDLAEGNTASVQKHLDLLRMRVDKMQKLIVGVLDYSRAGKDLNRRSKIRLSQFIGEVVDGMNLPENFSVEYSDQLPVVEFNTDKLRQVLQNLIANAARFNDKPKGTAHIDCSVTADKWTISVTDNGPGIPERYHEQIFSMFRTLKNRDLPESTGIGLPIVKKIIEEAGGTILVDREYKNGACFQFTILRP